METQKQLKLNYGRTLLVGLAFLSISAFWQLYDATVPLILKYTYGIGDGPSGIIMAMDNVVALFLLPLFGALSDKRGARIPFVIAGTVLAIIFMAALPFLDNSYATMNPTTSLILFFIALGLLLLSMAYYRSPAVALMAAVTPKPLRSKGNAVINLMGAVGGIITLAATKIIKTGDIKTGAHNYMALYIVVAVVMVISVVLLIITIRERKLVADMKAINYGVPPEEDQGKAEVVDGKERLPKPVLKSLVFILATIALWFMGYNAVTTAFTKYATEMWTSGLDKASLCLMIATVAAIISYIPIGFLSSRIGRKKMIVIGLICAVVSFIFAAFFARTYSIILYPMFILIGFAQAAITVNTFPMVWEISRAGNVGKYTGLYYTCAMSAQIVTPILSGYLLQYVGYDTLFPYAAFMVCIAIIPILLAKHGDSKPNVPKSKLEALDAND